MQEKDLEMKDLEMKAGGTASALPYRSFSEEHEKGAVGPPLSGADLRDLVKSVDLAVQDAGCDHTLRHTRGYLTTNGFEEEMVVAWLEKHGGYCDCEVTENVEERLARIAAP